MGVFFKAIVEAIKTMIVVIVTANVRLNMGIVPPFKYTWSRACSMTMM